MITPAYAPTATERVLRSDENGTVTVEDEEYLTGEKRLVRSAGDRYGIRYEELLAFMVAAL